MKRSPRRAWLWANSALAFAALLPVGGALRSAAAESQAEAKITVVVRDVKVLPMDESARPAKLNDTLTDNTAVRTGSESRSELTFLDLTITRLGSNTVYSFNKAGRSVELDSGSILFRVPKNSGGAHIKTDACSVAITGTTLILETKRSGRTTLAVLEGGVHMSLNKFPNETVFARGGQLLDVPPGARKMPKPVNINIKGVMKEHPLISYFPPLPNEKEIYANAGSKGSSGAPSPDPVVYNPPPLGPSGPVGPIGIAGGNYPAGGVVNIGPHHPRGRGESSRGSVTDGTANSGQGEGRTKGKKKSNATHNGEAVYTPLKTKDPGYGKVPRGQKGREQPVVHQAKPTATPKKRQLQKHAPTY